MANEFNKFKLAKWFAVNTLTLNLSKTKFRNRPPDIEINMSINNQQITRVHVKKCIDEYITETSNSVSLWSKTSGTYEHSFSTIRHSKMCRFS